MKCSNGCQLFGAYQAVAGIKDQVVLLHTVVGCHFGTMSFHLPQNMGDMRQSCTIINDKDIIFNGEQSLGEALGYMNSLYGKECVTVISGCVSQIIGDDIDSVLAGHNGKSIHINGAGFAGDFERGYEEALFQFGKKFCQPVDKAEVPTINILGLLYDDFKLENDIRELKRLLGDRITINCVTGDCTVEEFSQMPKAQLNIVIGRGNKLADYLEKQFEQPSIEMAYPYGLEGIKQFLGEIGTFFSIDFSDVMAEEENVVIAGIKRVYSYVQSFYGLPVCVVGSIGRGTGMKRFLEQELGMDVVSFFTTNEKSAMEAVIADSVNSDGAIVFGSSFEGDIANRLEVPLVRYEYPVYDRVAIGSAPYVGGQGVVQLIEDILNTVMNGQKSKGAMYNEKNLHLR